MNDIKKINRIYYYCSLEAFMSIMENSSIRMCDILKSNDSSEIEYGIKLLRRYLKNSCVSFSNEHIVDNTIKEFFINIDYNGLISEIINKNQLVYYCTCFSSERDLLSQWRGYANDGKGVAIGFYTQDFIDEGKYINVRFDKIIYDEETQKQCLINCIKSQLDGIKESKGKTQLCLYENAIKQAIFSFIYEIAFFKNEAFKEENEWRLVCYFNYNHACSKTIKNDGLQTVSACKIADFESETYNKGLINRKIRFKCTDEKVSSFIEFCFKTVKKSIISDVIIGPKAKADLTDISLFLCSNGYDLAKIKIRKSAATYQ